MANNLAYIDELGIGQDLPDSDTDAVENETTEESEEDLSLDSEEKPSENTESDTEQNSELLQSLKSQIEGMEKRIADKDDYIAQLREASKQKEADNQQGDTEVSETEDDDDFWANPELTIKQLKAELKEQREAGRIQQMQIQETIYANTVDDYWKTVNPKALQEAVATDEEFMTEFNSSAEPYKTAYEYLKNKADTKAQSELSLREQIKKELQEEMGLTKEKKEVPPNINTGGKSGGTQKKASEDGFAAVFGTQY